MLDTASQQTLSLFLVVETANVRLNFPASAVKAETGAPGRRERDLLQGRS